jgi:hypothetical protein
MRRAGTSLLVIALTSVAHSQVAPSASGETRPAMSCASLAGLKLGNATIAEATTVPAGSRDVSHCCVLGRIDKEINFTALPSNPASYARMCTKTPRLARR